MTRTTLRWAATSAAILAGAYFCLAASTAEAAKGVKKGAAGAGGQQTHTGEVIKVSNKNGVGSFQIRAAKNHKKTGKGAANIAGGQEFQVTKATQFVGSGPAGAKLSFSSLHSGEHVQVKASGPQAEVVQLLSMSRNYNRNMAGYGRRRGGYSHHSGGGGSHHSMGGMHGMHGAMPHHASHAGGKHKR